MEGLLAAALLHHGVNTGGAGEMGEPVRRSGVPPDHGDLLAGIDIALGTGRVADIFRHGDAPVVVAVGVAEAVPSLLDTADFVEAGVVHRLVRLGERRRGSRGLRHGVGLARGVVHRAGEHGLPASCLRGHAPVAVVGGRAGAHRAQPNFGQAVQVVVAEGRLEVSHVVFSRG